MSRLPVAHKGVDVEKGSALLDAKWMIDERGTLITYYKRGEANVSRDKYNSMKKKSTVPDGYQMYAFPITFNPIDDDLRKAGLREKVDLMIYTAMLDWTNFEIAPMDDIDSTRDTIEVMGKSYEIKEKGFTNHFSDTFLNVTFGLVLR